MKGFIKLLIVVFGLTCCGKSQENLWETPKKYIYKNFVPKSVYQSDSIRIVRLLRKRVKNQKGAFYSYTKEYFDTSKIDIEVDTILYNKDGNRVAILIIVQALRLQNSESKKGEIADLGPKMLFYGYGLVGKRIKSTFNLADIGVVISSNYEDKDELSARVREIHFHEINPFRKKNFRFNIDDQRMWNEPIWKSF